MRRDRGGQRALGPDGRLSATLTPGPGNAWFLVSASSCLGESSLGRASFHQAAMASGSGRGRSAPAAVRKAANSRLLTSRAVLVANAPKLFKATSEIGGVKRGSLNRRVVITWSQA